MKLLNTTIKLSAVLVLLILPSIIWGQAQDNSPYSRFGIGDISDNNFYYSRFMGGLGASFTSPYTINIVNPASLAYLGATSFDVGVGTKLARLSAVSYTHLTLPTKA